MSSCFVFFRMQPMADEQRYRSLDFTQKIFRCTWTVHMEEAVFIGLLNRSSFYHDNNRVNTIPYIRNCNCISRLLTFVCKWTLSYHNYYENGWCWNTFANLKKRKILRIFSGWKILFGFPFLSSIFDTVSIYG